MGDEVRKPRKQLVLVFPSWLSKKDFLGMFPVVVLVLGIMVVAMIAITSLLPILNTLVTQTTEVSSSNPEGGGIIWFNVLMMGISLFFLWKVMFSRERFR